MVGIEAQGLGLETMMVGPGATGLVLRSRLLPLKKQALVLKHTSGAF